MSAHPWVVVLAAGAGRRLAEVTGGVPKQFWRGVDGRSLLDHTLDRFSPLAPSSRTIVAVDAGHRRFVTGSTRPVDHVTYQPSDRGTAAGVLLALIPVLEADPDAPVVITPSDHGVDDIEQFRRGVGGAVAETGRRDAIVIFGVQPDEPRDDYGWICPGPVSRPGRFRRVLAFAEKPAPARAAQLFAAGAVWNTMVLVGRARAIRDLFTAYLPTLTGIFEAGLRLPPGIREAFFNSVYPSLPRHDFSRDVIAPAAGQLLTHVWPASLGWSDLGTPDRLQAWLRRPTAGRRHVTAAPVMTSAPRAHVGSARQQGTARRQGRTADVGMVAHP